MQYQNPVWPGYFADPFILRTDRGYFAYGTGTQLLRAPDGSARAFVVLHSSDLVRWTECGTALAVPPASAGDSFWAPEVAAAQGRYFLYYSSAPPDRDELHRLLVAVADDPAGPFNPVGRVLPEEDVFSIDAHPFQDPRDGRWYLFYARDYFDARTGTGLAVVPLTADLRRADGPSREVVRPNADWQIYERNRALYGRQWAAWHTVEGPCVVPHGGRYYCFYSGGNWQTHDYGVSYAVADHPLGPWRHADETGPVVLRGHPPDLLGPGHHSYIIGPAGEELLVYHAWDGARRARRMCLDRLVWTATGPRCLGPTATVQSF